LVLASFPTVVACILAAAAASFAACADCAAA
jgi:hypothetical protein